MCSASRLRLLTMSSKLMPLLVYVWAYNYFSSLYTCIRLRSKSGLCSPRERHTATKICTYANTVNWFKRRLTHTVIRTRIETQSESRDNIRYGYGAAATAASAAEAWHLFEWSANNRALSEKFCVVSSLVSVALKWCASRIELKFLLVAI